MPTASAGLLLKGGEELERTLSRLDLKKKHRAMLATIKKAAKPILQTAKAKAPRRSGLLRLSLGIKNYGNRGRGFVAAIVGARVRFKSKKADAIRGGGGKKTRKSIPANYAHLVEFGTAPHAISSPRGFLSFAGIVTKLVEHPGAKRKPFMRPAFNQNHRKSLEIIRRELEKQIDKALNI